jgi:GAF domain
MTGSRLNVDKFCDQCRIEANVPQYAGPLAEHSEEFDREVSRGLDRADAAALHELWHRRHTSPCPRCGADSTEQWTDAQGPAIKPPASAENLRALPKLDILDPDFLATADQQTILGALVGAALDHTPADTANAQLVDPVRGGLYIAAQQGFERPFLDFFAWVSADGSACATAAASGTPIMVPNVLRSPLFTEASRQAMRDARSYAVYSIPLLSSSGTLLGVFSCHYRRAGMPSHDVAPLLNLLAQAVAPSLQWHARHNGNGNGNGSRIRAQARRWRAGRRTPASGSQTRRLMTGLGRILT